MSFYSAEFVLEELITNLRRDRLISLATIGIVAVAACVLGAAALFVMNLGIWTERVASELKTTVYLKRDVPASRARGLRVEISRWPRVAYARLITKEEGWNEFRLTHPAVGGRLKDLPIPWTDAIEVHTTSAEDLPAVAKKLAKLEEMKDLVPTPEEIQARSGVPQKVIRFRSVVGLVAYLLIGAMAIAGFLIIHNTIRLSLFARRREISVMQLVGATPGFVAGPFLLEGALHGFLGVLLACCLLVPAHMYLRALAAHSGWTLVQLLPDDQLYLIAAILALAGMVLGFAGAALSLRRFLSHPVEMETH